MSQKIVTATVFVENLESSVYFVQPWNSLGNIMVAKSMFDHFSQIIPVCVCYKYVSSYPVSLILRQVLGEEKPVYEISLIEKDDKDLIADEIDNMLAENVISPSKSAYSAPIFLVKKKDGTWRPVIDFRGLNAVTKDDIYHIPGFMITSTSCVMQKCFPL